MNLQLSLKRKWFEKTKSKEKTEDYREITPYWLKRLFYYNLPCELDELMMDDAIQQFNDIDYTIAQIDEFGWTAKRFNTNIMTLGYPKSTDHDRILRLEHKGISIGFGREQWGAEPNKRYFIIKHGEIEK